MDDDIWTHTATGGPWPERIGLRCRIVPRPDGITTYPWNDRRTSNRRSRETERIILIENDPFHREHQTAEWYATAYGAEWSCAIHHNDITPNETNEGDPNAINIG